MFIAELRSLAKICNFSQYFETAIRDQFICGLQDAKCPKEWLCQTELRERYNELDQLRGS